MTDATNPTALVTREVRSGVRDGTPTKTTIARRTYSTDPHDLWDSVTNPDRLPRWFAPVTGDLRLGGRYQVEGNAGGVVEDCEEPTTFAVTWEIGGGVSWLRVTLLPDGDGRTILELVHEAAVDEHWDEFGPGAVGVGWDLAMFGLGMHLDTGEAVDPELAMTFTFTPEGVELVRTAATGWADAAAADGEDPATASAAGERTFAFYTTPPEGTP